MVSPTGTIGRLGAALVLLLVATATIRAQTIRELFDNTKASVVVIHTEGKELVSVGDRKGFVSTGALGSGVFIGDKKVVTAAHVIQTAEKVSVEFSGGQMVNARVATSEPFADVALLELEWVPTSAVSSTLGDSDAMGVGDQVYVIGAPYGLSYTLSVGYVSGRQTPGAKVSGLTQIELFQTDASINTGNSGGPMFNMNGEVVGIVSYILSRSGGFEGLGFAVTSNIARQLLLEQATGWTGMQGVFISDEHAAMLNIPQKSAILVESVAGGGLASQLGIQGGTVKSMVDGEDLILGGDAILSVNGIRIDDGDASLTAIRASLIGTGPGSSLRAEVLRAGEILELSTIVR